MLFCASCRAAKSGSSWTPGMPNAVSIPLRTSASTIASPPLIFTEFPVIRCLSPGARVFPAPPRLLCAREVSALSHRMKYGMKRGMKRGEAAGRDQARNSIFIELASP